MGHRSLHNCSQRQPLQLLPISYQDNYGPHAQTDGLKPRVLPAREVTWQAP
jgi:hypothetical protein